MVSFISHPLHYRDSGAKDSKAQSYSARSNFLKASCAKFLQEGHEPVAADFFWLQNEVKLVGFSTMGGWQTPFQQLENFEDSGCLNILCYILDDGKDWFSDRLTAEQQVRFEAIKAKMRSYQEIDAKYGPGASINLDHALLMKTIRNNRGGLQRYAGHLENAKRFREGHASQI
ncbi:hypothetical protein GGE67_005759 [Rhizobium leucaenae]|nr:hypothetical protein [Rhizobium leucaenae]